MPFIGYEELETRKFLIDHIKEMDFKFKFITFHGFETEKSTLEIADFKSFETVVRSINVIILIKIANNFKLITSK